jgi:hypothetical protein
VGGSGGAAIGAAFGAPFGPPGAAAGGLLGSGIGALVGLDSGRRQKNVLYGEKEIEKFIAGLIQIYLDYRGKKITLVKAQER